MINGIKVNNQYVWLDVFRFIAAFIVVITHVRGAIFVDYGSLSESSQDIYAAFFYAITRLGHEAVIVFFVLSGFLVGGKVFERIRDRSFKPGDYAIDRISRIWVPLIPALLLSVLLRADNASGLTVWVGNIFGLQGVLVPMFGGNGPLWSLAYEIWFYVFAYALGRLALSKSIDTLSLFLLLAVCLVFLKLKIQYLGCWLIGAAFYLKPHLLSNLKGCFLALLIGLFAIAGLQFSSGGFMAKFEATSVSSAFFELLLAISAGILCVSLVRIKANAVSNGLAPLASFSYTLYLTHYPLLVWVSGMGFKKIDNLNIGSLSIFVTIVFSCLFISWLIYLLFERNTGLVRGWLKRRFSMPTVSA